MKVFLSGSKTAVRLPQELARLIDSYSHQKASFLIGDCFGADLLIQEYLHKRGYPDVTVFVSGDRLRHHCDGYAVRHIPAAAGIRGFAYYRQKDIAMIEECDCAVMLWDGKTRGTHCIIEDLERMGKPFTVIHSDRHAVQREHTLKEAFPRWDFVEECYGKAGIADLLIKKRLCKTVDEGGGGEDDARRFLADRRQAPCLPF